MSQLTGNQINNSYQGLLKTESNGAITNPGTTVITDGLGNTTKLSLTLNNTANQNNILTFASEGKVLSNLKNTAWTRGSYPMGAVSGQNITMYGSDTSGAVTMQIQQDRYGSLYYKNIHGNNGEGHVFTSQTGTGTPTPAVIRMDTYNSVNNSTNWYTGYQQSVDALTISGQDLTVGRQGVADLTVTLPTSPDTTYVIGSAQNGTGSVIALDGSDATTTTVSLLAGTNITLTDTGNSITIDAAGGGAGGVTSIIAGTGISVDAATGDVTVTATGGGSAGLVAGTGARSLESSATVTPIAANAAYDDTLAIGNNALANAAGSMAIGSGAQNTGAQSWASIALGQNCTNGNNGAVAIGGGAKTTGTGAFAVGDSTRAYGGSNIAFGAGVQITGGTNNSFIGSSLTISSGQGNTLVGGSGISMPAGQNDNVGIGRVSGFGAGTSNSISIGLVSSMGPSCNDTVIIGRGSSATSGAQNSVAIGRDASVTTTQAVALGYQTVADRSNFVTVNQLDVKTVGGGVIMYSPDGTAYKLTVANGGTLVISAA